MPTLSAVISPNPINFKYLAVLGSKANKLYSPLFGKHDYTRWSSVEPTNETFTFSTAGYVDDSRRHIFSKCSRCIDRLSFKRTRWLAERTGTLWEHDQIAASCNHGFTSYVIKWIISAYTGIKGIKNGELIIDENIKIKDCYLELPYLNKVFIINITNKKRTISVRYA